MQIALNKNTNIAIYCDIYLMFTPKGLRGSNFLDPFYTEDNCTIIDDVEIPKSWYPNVYLYDGEKLVITEEGSLIMQERINKEQEYENSLITFPVSVSRFQARQALRIKGYFQFVEIIMSQPEIDPLMLGAWQDALTFDYESETVKAIAYVLALNEQQLLDLFILADSIKA